MVLYKYVMFFYVINIYGMKFLLIILQNVIHNVNYNFINVFGVEIIALATLTSLENSSSD